MLGSVATSNVTVSCIVPSFELVDCMYNMLSTPFICCSSGVAIADSIVSASAPVYVADTLICGGMISGNCAIGSAWIDTSPATTVTMAMTMATIGRPMKKRDTSVPSAGGKGRGVHDGAVARRRALDDNAGAGLQPVLDDPSAADAVAD